MRYFQYYLRKKGIYTRTAHFSAAAQLVASDNEYVAGVFGGVNCLVFGADKIITEFNWATKRVRFIDSDVILEKLVLKHEQFVDLMLLSGSSILAPMPEIDNDTPASKIAQARAVLGRADMDGLTACRQAKDDEYLKLFMKAKRIITHIIIVQPDGLVVQKEWDHSPNDIHEVVAYRMPDVSHERTRHVTHAEEDTKQL